jgi:hypothetical protein
MDTKYFIDDNDPNWIVVEEKNNYIKLLNKNIDLGKFEIKIIRYDNEYKMILFNLESRVENEIFFSSLIPNNLYLTILHYMLLNEKK